MSGTCGTHGEKIDAYRALMGKPGGKRPFERPRSRWDDDIKICFKGSSW
jgi:hypothetical protein